MGGQAAKGLKVRITCFFHCLLLFKFDSPSVQIYFKRGGNNNSDELASNDVSSRWGVWGVSSGSAGGSGDELGQRLRQMG